MPIKTNKDTEHNKLISMYVNSKEYLQFLTKVAENEGPKTSSAVLRTLMFLYTENLELQKLVKLKVKNFIVFNKDGKQSKL